MYLQGLAMIQLAYKLLLAGHLSIMVIPGKNGATLFGKDGMAKSLIVLLKTRA